MGRIRTIKPEFFTHDGLFDAEAETGLPLRLAFAGLWTQCDREGRFAWKPRQLKTAILPYDDVDFSRVLDALATRGFIVKYGCDARDFGYIPTWTAHQSINNREAASSFPQPPDPPTESDVSSTRGPRVTDLHVHAQGEGKGKEGKEEEPNGSLSGNDVPDVSKPKAKSSKRAKYPDDFDAAWLAYPTTQNMSKAEAFTAWSKLSPEDRVDVAAAIPGYIAFCQKSPDYQQLHMVRFITKRRFEGYVAQSRPAKLVTVDAWAKRLTYGRHEHRWSTAEWGPRPGLPGCLAPPELLQADDGEDWSEYRQKSA